MPISQLPPNIRDRITVEQRSELVSTPCWIWNGYRDGKGYGHTHRCQKGRVQTHRYVYELTRGPIPEGLQLDHLCRITSCANPDHLEPVTNAENHARSVRAKKHRCEHGHPLIEPNLILKKGRAGATYRNCRVCAADAVRRSRGITKPLRPSAIRRRELLLAAAEGNIR